MSQVKGLIGWPTAGVAWRGSTTITGQLICRGEPVPSSWLLGLGNFASFDVTGAGQGPGVRCRRARVDGARDAGAVQARAFLLWELGAVAEVCGIPQAADAVRTWSSVLGWFAWSPALRARRAAILAGMAADRLVADRLQRIAQRAAYRAAGRIDGKRGVVPSDTSVLDAAADAVARALLHLPWLVEARAAARLLERRYLRAVYLFAGRGATQSLRTQSAAGITGRNEERRKLNTASLDDPNQAPWLAEWQASGGAQPGPGYDQEHAARGAFVRAVFAASVRPFLGQRGAGAASGRRAALARARVVGCVVLRGESLELACEVCGFASVKVWRQATSTAGLWSALRLARASSPVVARLRRVQRGHAAAYVIARRRGDWAALLAARDAWGWARQRTRAAAAANLAAWDTILARFNRVGEVLSLHPAPGRKAGRGAVDARTIGRASGSVSPRSALPDSFVVPGSQVEHPAHVVSVQRIARGLLAQVGIDWRATTAGRELDARLGGGWVVSCEH